MDKKIVGLIGTISSLTLIDGVAQAAVGAHPLPVANSYAELLTPIPNAIEQLKVSDALLRAQDGNAARVEKVWHHHHHHWYRHHHHHHWYHHHHHHHWYHHHHHHYYPFFNPYYSPY